MEAPLLLTGTRMMVKFPGTKHDKAMKKTLILFATAFVACVACNKEISAPVVMDGYTITAISPDTKATVDGLQVQWTTGDQVALFQTSGDPVTFTLKGEGPVTTGTFSSDVAVSPNGIAAFPAYGAGNLGSTVSIQVPETFAYGTTPIPMIGRTTDGKTFNFSLVTGGLLINIKDVPPYPCSLVVTSDQNLTGDLVVDLATNAAEFAPDGAGKTFTVTNIPKGNVNLVLPVLAGTHNVSVKLVAADGTTVVPRSNKSKANLAVELAKIAPLKQIDLEEGSPAPVNMSEGGTFDLNTLPGKWNVLGDNSSKNGALVLGGGGAGDNYLAWICPYDKTWDWDASCYRESDNGLVVKVTAMSATEVSGTINWWAGNDGEFWNYTWKFANDSKPEYKPFYGTDLSGFYNKIPKGEKAFTLDLSTMTATLANGEKPKILTAGKYQTYNRTLTIPDGCFAMMFHLGNLKPYNSTWGGKDIDRFMFCALEYVIIFERTGDLT